MSRSILPPFMFVRALVFVHVLATVAVVVGGLEFVPSLCLAAVLCASPHPSHH